MRPRLALSVRQPWAWAIIHGGKDIENRSQLAITKGRMRGACRIAVHSSKGLGRDEYLHARGFMRKLGVTCPDAVDLRRGGVIGTVMVLEIVRTHSSPWFFGPRGLVLLDPQPCEFVPAVGELGYFAWNPGKVDAPPAPWMLKQAQGSLLDSVQS